MHLSRVEITGPGVRDVVDTKAGVPANHAKHLTLVRRDAAKPDFPPGEYRTTFEGTAGGQPFRATCTHPSP